MTADQPAQFQEVRDDAKTLNTVAAGLAIAARIIEHVRSGVVVQVSLVAAERMTPSFANALVMTLIESLGIEAFRARVRLEAKADSVREQWNAAIDRYERGIRLTTQRPGAA